jgi:tetratricopeptide (TPR) repeat protein
MDSPSTPDSPPADSAAIQRVNAAVLDYSTGTFDLGSDLRHLDRVQHIAASEATIFYSARILEALTADALQAAGLPTSSIVPSNLMLLQQFNLIPTTTRYWAHSLRFLGNTVRHVRGRVTVDDAQLSLEFVQRTLEWFFCRRRDGIQLAAITLDGGPIWQNAIHPDLHAVMEMLDDPNFDANAGARRLEETQSRVLHSTPALPAVLADILLDRKLYPVAQRVLERAREKFPGDVRLQQLTGLLHSRTGDLPQAMALLEPLYHKFAEDDETAGILGGIYKRCWQHEGAKTDWLVKSHRAYSRGWERSKYSNAYPGINAATTALWLSRTSESKEIAEKVRDLLRKRADAIHAEPSLVFDYWDQVSLAEAELLAGNLDEARRLYRDAFARYAQREGDIDVSKNQLTAILPWLGISATPDEFLAHPPTQS